MSVSAIGKDQNRLTPAASASIDNASRLVLILGAPRSGTSWLGKIFDSHPSVIYRHEPDSVLRSTDFPVLCPMEDIPQYVDAVRRYVARLSGVRQVKTSGSRPVFAKPFQPLPAPLLRRTLALGLRASESIVPHATWPRRVPIPDFIRGEASSLTYVLKSVSLLGAAALVATALPESRIIAVFRHPCGQLASVKREPASPLLPDTGLVGPVVSPRARELGITRERYDRLPAFDRHVWAWALLHDKLVREATDIPNVHLLRYEDLCLNPIEQARALMAFARLPWAVDIERFIEQSTRSNDRVRYFSVFRDPIDAAMKWKRELAPDEIARVKDIVEQVLPGRFSYD